MDWALHISIFLLISGMLFLCYNHELYFILKVFCFIYSVCVLPTLCIRVILSNSVKCHVMYWYLMGCDWQGNESISESSLSVPRLQSL